MQNFMKKLKFTNLEPKRRYLGIFGRICEKNIVIFEISILEFVKNEFLAHTVNFGRGFAFSRSPGSQSAL